MAVALLPNNNNNWVANALVNFVGPLIGDWIKSEREKEINRKNNAALNEVINHMNLGNNDFSNLPPSLNNNNGGLLGGSNNGWENAFRNISDNPTSQFDNNTANIAPNANVSATLNQTQQHIPTPAEFLQNMYSVVGSNPKRFGLVNLENLQKLAAPIMAAYQADLTKQGKQKLADEFLNAAGDYAKQRNIMTSGYINGTVPHEAVADATHNYEFENPHLIPGAYDAGGENYFYNYNPRTGDYNFNTQVNKSLSPQDVQRGQQNDREYELKVRQQEWNEQKDKWIMEHPELQTIVGENGRLWGVDPRTGKATPALTPDGEPIYVNPQRNGSTGTTSYDREFIRNREYQKTELNKRRRELEKARREAYSDEEKQKYTQEIEKIDADINKLQKEIDDRLQYSQNYQNGDAVRYRMPDGQGITYSTIAEWERQIQSGETANFGGKLVKTVDELHARLRELGAVDEGASVNKYRRNPTNNNNSSADVTPQNIQSAPSSSTNNTDNTEFEPVDVDSANQGIAFRNPSNGKTITKEQFYEDIKREREKEIFQYGKSPEQTFFDDERIIEQVVENYKSQGYRDIRLANSPNRNNTSVAQSNTSTGVGKTPFPTAEEKERADTQGSTGSDIARVPEKQNEAVLNGDNPPNNNSNNDEYNSEVMWTHPDGTTITKAEYQKRLREGNMSEEKAVQLYESLGYRRADNSNSTAPVGTDYVNGTTPQHTKAQIDYLNGNDVRNGTTFMGEYLPGLSPHGAMAASLTPMGLSRTLNNSNNSNVQDYLQNNEPPAYNPYDINADTGQPYDENDVYEQGFEYDDDASNGIVTPEVKNKGYNVLPLADLSNHAPKPADYGYYLPPVGQKGLNHIRPMPPIGQTYPDIPDTPAQSNIPQDNTPQSSPKQSMQPQNNNQQNRYKGVRFPKREARRPGKIKPNTSYQDLKPIVDDAARNNRLEPELVRAIIQIESKWDSNALSHVGAKGLMQLMPGTAREVGIRDSYDAVQNINGGSKYIARMIKMFNGNIAHALMAYNWGPGNMRAALKGRKSIPAGVRKYARDILNIYNSLKRK